MSDDLIVSGSGRFVVASDELLAHAEGLVRLAGELDAIRSSLAHLTSIVSPGWLRRIDAPLSALTAEEFAVRSMGGLSLSRAQCNGIAFALRAAMEAYGRREALTADLAQALSARLGWALGFLSPLLLLVALPALGFTAAGMVIGALTTGRGTDDMMADLGTWIIDNNEVLTNPVTVALIRGAVGSSDDFLGGALRMPPEVVSVMGDEGLGLAGVTTSAALVALLGSRFGLLGESPVVTARRGTVPVASPVSLADRAGRIPRPNEEPGGGQIRIDRYQQPGQPDRFDVYIAGTVDFSLVATSEPFDMTSNVSGVAGLPAGSYGAVIEAMEDAGVTARTPVQLTGYSQGGLIASMVASSGTFDVRGITTFGAPAGHVSIPAGIPVLTVRHSEDLVPATGGYDTNSQAVVVERAVFAGGEIPPGTAIPAHQLDYYESTAGLIDEADSRAVRAAVGSVNAFSSGASVVESTTYAARRVEPGYSGGR